MSRSLVPWSLVAVLTLIVADAASSELPGTAKPVPESEKSARLDLPAGALARLGVRPAQPDGRILLAAFSPDGKRVALCGRNDTVTLWDVATGKQVREFEGLSPVYCFAFSPDGKYLATGNSDRAIHLWEVSSGKERRELAGQQGGISFLSFSPDGKTLASGDGGAVVRLWAVATGKELLQIAKQDSPVVAIAFLPDGKTMASASYDGSIRFCETATGKELRHIDAPQVAAAQGGGMMGMGGGGGPGGMMGGGPGGGGIGGMPGGPGPGGGGFGGRAMRSFGRVNCFSFSPDGKLFGAAYQGQLISIRESATGRELHQVASVDTSGYTYALSLSPDGRTFATAGADGKVRLWEVASGKQRRQFKPDTLPRNYPIGSVAFAPDGRRLLSSAQDNSALIWDVYALKGEPEELQELWTDLACEAASTAYAAVCQMIAAPEQSVPFLREHLQSVKDKDSARIAQLIADLDSDRFDAREKAMTELAKLPAEPALRKVLAGSPSLEVRRRIDQLLEKFRKTGLTADQLREIRAAEILEHIGNPASQAVLKELANGAAGSLFAEEAKSALARLAKRPAAER